MGARSPRLVATEPGTVALAHVLDQQLQKLLKLEAGVRDQLDAEALHDFRVAMRRTRSITSLAKKQLPREIAQKWKPEWAWLAGITTTPRDLDVLLDDIEAARSVLPGNAKVGLDELAELVMARRGAAQEELRTSLAGDRYRALTSGWHASLGELALSPGTGDTAEELARNLASKAGRQMARQAASIEADAPVESIHDLRKRTKRLRYVLELFGEVLPTTKVKATVNGTKRLQDDLGRFQDNEVHRELVDSMRNGTPGLSADASAASRLLLERYDQRRASARRALAKDIRRFVKDAPTFT